jgi:hypothetical protein
MGVGETATIARIFGVPIVLRLLLRAAGVRRVFILV